MTMISSPASILVEPVGMMVVPDRTRAAKVNPSNLSAASTV